MLRLVLAVALAASLVAVAAPAVEDARTTRTERLVERELGRVAAAANTLAREEAPAARRTVEVSFPGDSPTEAPLAFVALGGLPGADERQSTLSVGGADTGVSDVLAFGVAGGRLQAVRVEVDVRVVGEAPSPAPDSRPLVLRGGETHRLTLRLVRHDGRPVVLVEES